MTSFQIHIPTAAIVLCITLGFFMIARKSSNATAFSSDDQAEEHFAKHKADFQNLKVILLAEKQQKFVVQRKSQSDYRISPPTGQIASTTIDACKKLMREIDADKVVRNGGVVGIRIRLVEHPEEIEEENIVFGDNDRAAHGPGLQRKFIALGSGWIIVKDKINLRTGAINLK